MSQVIAWKSDHDGALFEDKAEYITHLRTLAAERMNRRKQQKFIENRDAFLDQMGQVGSIKELEQFIKDNWEKFFLNAIHCDPWHSYDNHDLHALKSIKFSSMTWRDLWSNSHSCPRGGETNWHRDQDKPLGYPGWKGRIDFEIESNNRGGFGSRYFEGTSICTGTGGGGIYRFGYDVTLWASDFPVMWEKLQKEQFWNALKGT